jgi:rubrerythrin
MPATQHKPGFAIKRSSSNGPSVQRLSYLLANKKISEEEAIRQYDALLATSRRKRRVSRFFERLLGL